MVSVGSVGLVGDRVTIEEVSTALLDISLTLNMLKLFPKTRFFNRSSIFLALRFEISLNLLKMHFLTMQEDFDVISM